jgi:hypothetical protein
MKVVWKLDTATVREVYESLREKRAIAYTTVMTVMDNLHKKGWLRREPADPKRGDAGGRGGALSQSEGRHRTARVRHRHAHSDG